MKISLTTLLLFSTFFAVSQYTDSSVLHFYSNVLAQIEDDDILADLSPYSDLLRSDNNSLLSDRQLHRKKIVLGKLCSPNSTFTSIDSFEQLNSQLKDQGVIPLSLIHKQAFQIDQNYTDSLKVDTINKSLIFNNSHNIFLKPFTIKSFCSMDEVRTSTVSFILPTSLIYQDSTLNNISINFGDGNGAVPIIPDSIYIIHFDNLDLSEGPVKVSIEIAYNIGQKKYYNKTETYAYEESVPDQRLLVTDLELTNKCALLDEEDYNQAEINIRYGKYQANIKQIKRPFLLIEGFDFDLNPADDRYGDLNYTSVIQGITFSEVSGYPIKTNLADLSVFSERLYQEGYDLIFINFKDGSSDLFKNGNSLIKIIQWVNQTKVGNEELMVFGASMGGLIARYALRKMELENCNHCTKLYGSFDSPHQGASIPLSLQYTVDFLSKKGFDTEYGNKALASIAAQQMLIYNITPGASIKRQKWQNWLNTYGHPKLSKRVSITNGDPGGKAPYAEGQALYANCYKTKGVELFKILLYAGKSGGNAAYIKLPKGNSNFSKYMNGLFNNYDIKKYNYPKGYTYYDHASGGQAPWLYETHLILQGYIDGFKNNSCNGPSLLNNGLTTFIPTYSALDLEQEVHHPNLKKLLPRFPVDMTSKTSTIHPFHSIFYHNSSEPGKNENQMHVLVDADINQNVDWIFEQIYSVSSELPSLLPYSSSQQEFNLSNEEDFELLISNISLIKDGKLILNGNRKKNFGMSYDPHPIDPYKKQYFRTSSCGTTIKIHKDGTLQIGEPSIGNSANISAELRLLEGSILEVFSEGKLIINEGSKLIIEPGAQLIYHPGAELVLDGPNSCIEVKGELTLLNNALLQFTSAGSNTNGYIVLDNSNNINNQCINQGSNCKIELKGQNRNDRLLWLKGFSHTINAQLDEIIIEKGEIYVEGRSGLIVDTDCDISEVLFNGNGTSQQGFGLSVNPNKDHLLDKIWFSNLTTACIAETSTTVFNMTNSTIGNCSDGLLCFSEFTNLLNTNFNSCRNGIVFSDGLSLELNRCILKDCGNGILDLSTRSNDMNIQESHFESNTQAVQLSSGNSCFIGCTNFLKNQLAIKPVGASIYLTDMNPFSISAGSNSFIDNIVGIKGHGEIHLESGRNNFVKSSSISAPFIDMSIGSTCYCLQGPSSIKADQNFWSPAPPTGSLGGSKPVLYQIRIGTGASSNPGDLIGNAMASVNSGCLNFPSDPLRDKRYKLQSEKDAGELKVHVYPNPAHDFIEIAFQANIFEKVRFELFSDQGQLLYSEYKYLEKDKKVQLDLSDLSKGLYHLTITSNNTKTHETIFKN